MKFIVFAALFAVAFAAEGYMRVNMYWNSACDDEAIQTVIQYTGDYECTEIAEADCGALTGNTWIECSDSELKVEWEVDVTSEQYSDSSCKNAVIEAGMFLGSVSGSAGSMGCNPFSECCDCGDAYCEAYCDGIDTVVTTCDDVGCSENCDDTRIDGCQKVTGAYGWDDLYNLVPCSSAAVLAPALVVVAAFFVLF